MWQSNIKKDGKNKGGGHGFVGRGVGKMWWVGWCGWNMRNEFPNFSTTPTKIKLIKKTDTKIKLD